jgi:hypothetical protein
MSYLPRPLSGLGGVENCGSTQVWDPNIEAYGQKGQCMPRASYTADQLVNPSSYPGVVKTKDTGGGIASVITSFFTALTPPAQQQQPTTIIHQAPAGMSTNTKIALAAGGALLLIAVVAATRR